MDDKERERRGVEIRRKILGEAWVDRSEQGRNNFNAEWLDFINRCAWAEVWTRPHFDERTRRILVIGTMIAIGRWEEFRMHVGPPWSKAGSRPTTSRRSSCSRPTTAACRPATMPSSRHWRC